MIRVIKGDTFSVYGTIKSDSVTDFTGYAATSQVKTAKKELVANLTFEWVNAAQGVCRLTDDTTEWPVGTHQMDIRLVSPTGIKSRTGVDAIQVVEGITDA